MTNTFPMDTAELDDGHLDDDLEDFQFIDDQTIKDENIANIIQDLMTMEDCYTEEDMTKPEPVASVRKPPTTSTTAPQILASSKPQMKPSRGKPVFITCKPVAKLSNKAKSKPTKKNTGACKPTKLKAAQEARQLTPIKQKNVIIIDKKMDPSVQKQEYLKFLSPSSHKHAVAPRTSDLTNRQLLMSSPDHNKENNIQHQQMNKTCANKITVVTAGQKVVFPAASKKVAGNQLRSSFTAANPGAYQSEEKTFKVPTLLEEKHPKQENSSTSFIGDWKRMFITFDHLEENFPNTDEYRVQKFMENLDTWGVTEDVPRPVFDGFSMASDPCSGLEMSIPTDWKDDETFSEIDKMVVSENVFLHKWLPKCALRMRTNPYRQMLRKLNEKDPYFSIMW